MQRFGEKLRTLRHRRGLTLKETASALDVAAHSYISKLENGEKLPSLEMALKIARLFDVCLDRLVKDELDLK